MKEINNISTENINKDENISEEQNNFNNLLSYEIGENEVVEDLMIENLKIIQDKRYYHFTSDSVLLSRFASSKKDDIVGDFCSGSGIVALNYYGLNKKNVKKVTLFELQKELCNISEKSIKLNKLNGIFNVEEGKLQNADKKYSNSFSLILCNPPYKKKNSGEQSLTSHIALCRHEVEITLEEIVQIAKRLLKPGGRFCICQRIERLTDLLYLLRLNNLEPYDMAFVSTKDGTPYLVLVESAKGKKPQLKIRKTIINGD